MFRKIAAVQALDGLQIMLWFADGEVRLFDVNPLIASRTEFSALADEAAFRDVKLTAEGYGVSWGDELDLGCQEMYEASKPADVVDHESARVIGGVVKARHDAGLSQAKLAAAAGVKQPVVARLETRVNSPRLDTLLKVLTPLGKTIRIVDLADEYKG